MNAGTRRGRILLALFAVVALACVSASVSASGGKPRTPIPKAKLKVSPLKLTRVFQSAKSVSGRIAQSDPALLGRSDSTPVNVLIKYDVDPTASYDGGVNGLAPTSPEATGKPLASNRSAVNAYTSYANTVIQKTSNAVQSAASNVRITRSFTAVYGGVAARLPANQVGSVLGVKGVVAVQEDSRQQPSTSVTPQFIGATAVWPSLGGLSKAGDGVVIGVIDSGIWPEHPSFADNAGLSPPKGSYACQFGQAGHPDLGPAFACNKKLIGAYAFTDTYQSVFPDEIGPGQFCDAGLHVCSARDSDGHGSNIAAIAAGDPVAGAPLYGVDRGPISGMAPGAKIIAYRVCLDQGCFDSDSIEAIEQAITDGVDVINYSISGDPNPYTDPVELAFLDAFHAGISVMASGGNDGPESGTVEHGGPWVTTAGASTSPRQLFTTTLHLRADGGASFDKPGVTITGGVSSPTPVVLAGSLGDPRCLNPFAPKSVTGKIVACERGGILRIDKSFNVKQGGAAGIIVYNTTQTDLALDNYWVPGIQLNAPNDDLTTFISTHKNVTATWAPATPTPGTPDVMASFSSRGPSTDFIKPDVTAPGVSILAAETPRPYPDDISLGPPGQLYQVISGTSMASPHVAGSAALIKAAHPDWTPAEIKSALMTSAVQDVVKEDGSTPADPFDDGSGSIRVNRAVNPTLVFNEEFRHFVHSIDHPLGRIDLNLPSIDAPVMPGLVTTDRTAINVSGADQMLDVSTSAPSGATITVDSDNGPLRVAKGAKVKFRVTISAPSLADGQYFGSIMLTPRGGGTPVYIPVAFTKQQGAVSLQASCDPTSFKVKTGHSHCTVSAANTDAAPAQVSVTVMNATPQDQLTFSNVTTSGQQVHNDASGLRWSGTLRPALAPPIKDVSKVGPANYLSLSGLGVPNLGLGDETMGVIDGLPAYTYGMEVYTQLGIDSNGYLVVGDASDADNDSVPQTFPDSSVPNNVLAPYWTDLDASQPGAYVGAAILDDGSGNQWIVVDYENVPIYGTGTKESFEVWIASTTIGEVITYDYPTGGITGAGGPDGLNVGAENRDGSSGINVSPVPSGNSEYLVTAGAPQAGGSVTIQFDASSTRVGQNSLLAQMASNLTPGLTQQQETLTVTP